MVGGAIRLKRIKDIKFLLIRSWKTSKRYCLITATKNIFQATLSLINIVGLGMVVNALVTNESYDQIIALIIVYLSINLGIVIVGEILQLLDNNTMRKVSNVAQFNYSRDSVNVN